MSVLKRLFSDKIAVFCMIVIAAFVIVAIGAPVLAPHDPAEIDVTNKFAAMSAAYPLGTDQLGRCMLSRMMYGARTTIFVSLYTMAITIFIGSVLGIISGFFRGWVDEVIMRICDIMLSFPSEVMILSIIGVLGIGMQNLVIATIIAKRNTGNQSPGCDMGLPGQIDSFPQAPGTALHPDAPDTAGRASARFSAFLRSGCPHPGCLS